VTQTADSATAQTTIRTGIVAGLSGLAAAADQLALFAARRIVDRVVMPTVDQFDAVRRTAEFYTSAPFIEQPRRFFPFLDGPIEVPKALAHRRDGGSGAAGRFAIRFESPYRALNPAAAERLHAFTENRVVRAQWSMHDCKRARTVAVALHGFAMGSPRADQAMLLAPGLYEAGLDIVMMTFPLHGKRGPAGSRLSGAAFIQPDLGIINEAMAQALHDLAALIAWLRSRGVERIGLIGLSLGGYLAALAAELLDDLDFVVPMAAPASFGDLAYDFMVHSAHFRGNRAAVLDRDELDSFFRVHCPLAHPAPVSNGRLMLVRGEGDRIVPRSHTDRLAAHWAGPRLHVAPAGHLVPIGRSETTDAVVSFLREIESI